MSAWLSVVPRRHARRMVMMAVMAGQRSHDFKMLEQRSCGCQSVSGLDSCYIPFQAGISSPYKSESLVEAEFFIGSQDGDLLAQGLRDDLSIKGIAMVEG